MSTYTTVPEVATGLGRPTDSITEQESAQWTQWIEQVEGRIDDALRARGTTLADAIESGKITVATIRRIVRPKIVAKADNPQGATSVTRSVDDGSVTIRREGAATITDPLQLSPEEWSQILNSLPRRSRVFSVLPR